MSADGSLLQHRPFVQFWIARVSTTVALQMMGVAVGWQIYELTGSALDLGLVGLAQFVPALLLLLVAGHFADRYDRRRSSPPPRWCRRQRWRCSPSAPPAAG